MHIELNYTLTVEDLLEWLYFNATQPNAKRQTQPSFTRRTWILVFVLAAISGLFVLLPGVLALAATRGPGITVSVFLSAALTALVTVGWILLRRFQVKPSAKQISKAFPELADPRRVLLTDEGITIETATSSNTMIWKHFIRIVELQGSFALVETAKAAHLLPKRSFASSGQLIEFRLFTLTYLAKAPAGFPVQPPAQATSIQ